MCLAIYKPAGVTIPPEHIKQGWISNSDGGGFAYTDGKKVKFSKGLMTLKDFEAAYNEAAEKFTESKFVLHFRIRSQGSREESNTHPFPFKHGVAIHNGTINGTGSRFGEGKSDTALFMEKFGDRFSHKLVVTAKTELEEAIGRGNKIVLLYNNGAHIILNENQGFWDGGVWYSTKAYVPRSMVGGNIYGMGHD